MGNFCIFFFQKYHGKGESEKNFLSLLWKCTLIVIMDVGIAIGLLGILCIAMFIGGMVGFADALIFIPLAAIFVGTQTAIVLSGFRQFLQVIVLEKLGYDREKFIANFSALSLVLTFPKLGVYLMAALFPPSFLGIYLIGLPLLVLAVMGGHAITRKIPVAIFSLIVLGILLMIGVRDFVQALLLLLNAV